MIFSLAIAAAACIENDAASAFDETTMFPMNLPHRPAGSLSPGHKGAPNGRSNNSAPPPSFLPESFSLYFFASGRGTSVSPPLRSFFFGPRLPSPPFPLFRTQHNSNSSNNAGDAPLLLLTGDLDEKDGGDKGGWKWLLRPSNGETIHNCRYIHCSTLLWGARAGRGSLTLTVLREREGVRSPSEEGWWGWRRGVKRELNPFLPPSLAPCLVMNWIQNMGGREGVLLPTPSLLLSSYAI